MRLAATLLIVTSGVLLAGWSPAAAGAEPATPSTDASSSPAATAGPGASASPTTSVAPSDSASPTPPALHLWVQVSPSSAVPGATVTVTGQCGPRGSGYIISPAFVHDAHHDFAGVGAVDLRADADGRYTANAVISPTATPGSYWVSIRCDGGVAGGTALTVIRPAAPTAVPAGAAGRAAPTGVGTIGGYLALLAAGLALVTGCTLAMLRIRQWQR